MRDSDLHAQVPVTHSEPRKGNSEIRIKLLKISERLWKMSRLMYSVHLVESRKIQGILSFTVNDFKRISLVLHA
jgi:hypothetical protein